MKKALRKLGMFLPFKIVLFLDYGRAYRKILNLNNPQYFGEKIQWLKLYGNLEQFSLFVDKFEVRNFIKNNIGTNYLTKLYGIYNSPEEIEYEMLPEQFVIKMTNGTGGNIICKDKGQLNIKEVHKKLRKWQREKLYKYTKEMQYKNIPPRIICEEYLEDESGSLRDFKFHCARGKVFLIEVHSDRFTSNHTENYYTLDWEDAEIVGTCKKGEPIKKPSNLHEMIEISCILSKDFIYIRVDLYSVNNQIYFGELTLTPANGTDVWFPLEKDKQYAKMIDITLKKNSRYK